MKKNHLSRPKRTTPAHLIGKGKTLEDSTMLRLSLDAKARVNIGLFDRGGKNRITVETNDHDFNPKTTLTP